ncbi:MAG: hypothetical protein KDK10_09075 [Maritimibacter sp.]|nr:hypothetical protein [Maritimibacter sp.]
MRRSLAVLIPLLAPFAAAAEPAQCEYRNPDRPDWNFFAPCEVTIETAGDRTTRRARAENGSSFTITEEGVGEILRFTVNDKGATRVEDGASQCYLTDAAAERVCIHPAGTLAAPADDLLDGADTTAPLALTEGIDPAMLGGGEKGECLAWITGPAGDGLIEHGACVRRENCAVAEQTGVLGCLTDFAWASGRTTAMTAVEGVVTLDGAVAIPGDNGCFTDNGAGLSFCFREGEMTAELYPALNAPPAPEPAPPPEAVAAPEADPGQSAAPSAAFLASVPAEAAIGACIYLRGPVEVSRWACYETVACEAPICTVTYTLDDGTEITLDTAGGEVMLMNGTRANLGPWSPGAGVTVTRPGGPYTFRFEPQAGSAMGGAGPADPAAPAATTELPAPDPATEPVADPTAQ